MAMDVSIVILNYNTSELLGECLRSLYQFPETRTYEIIVVDNGSLDSSCDHIRSNFPDVKIIRNEKNIGFSRGNNTGALAARGSFVLFLNSDTLFTGNCIAPLAELLHDHPDVGAVGPKLLNADGSLQLSCGSLPNLFVELWDKVRYSLHRRGGKSIRLLYDRFHRRTRETGWITGACMMVRSDTFRSLGGFDENYFMYFEDKDLCRRLKKSCWKIMYFPSTAIVHLLGGTSKKSVKDEINRYYRESQKYYYERHLNRFHRIGLQFYFSLSGKG